VIRGAAGVHVVGVDLQLRTVVHQAIEHIGRLVVGRRHHLDVVGAMLIRDMGIEADAGVWAVPGVDLSGGVAPLAGPEKLAIRG
jgi:hypothetical protein